MTYFDIRPATEADVGLQAAGVGDFVALLKPRVMSLVVFTGLVGMVIAPGAVHPVIGFIALLCIAVGAGAAGALNMWYDADIDGLMRRTRSRPVPAGRVTPGEALAFGLTLAVGSVTVMGLLIGPLPAALLAFTIFFYAVVYTMWLKRRTPENIVIGGAAGALPPVIGWAAATGSVSLDSMVLFAIIFLWTPPHFWALALLQSADYERAKVPMLPVVAGERVTRRRIVWYSLVLAPLGVLPALIGLATPAYGAVAIALGAVFVWLAVRVLRSDATNRRPPGQLFAFSILYLFLLFAALLGEHAVAGLGLLT